MLLLASLRVLLTSPLHTVAPETVVPEWVHGSFLSFSDLGKRVALLGWCIGHWARAYSGSVWHIIWGNLMFYYRGICVAPMYHVESGIWSLYYSLGYFVLESTFRLVWFQQQVLQGSEPSSAVCMICLDGGNCRSFCKNFHPAHMECMTAWYGTRYPRNACPMCRMPLETRRLNLYKDFSIYYQKMKKDLLPGLLFHAQCLLLAYVGLLARTVYHGFFWKWMLSRLAS